MPTTPYDVEKVLDFTGDEPEYKYKMILSAKQLQAISYVAYQGEQYAGYVNDSTMARICEGVSNTFRALARQLSRPDLDSIEGFKAARPLPVPAMARFDIESNCE